MNLTYYHHLCDTTVQCHSMNQCYLIPSDLNIRLTSESHAYEVIHSSTQPCLPTSAVARKRNFVSKRMHQF